MSDPKLKRFGVRGVFWRQLLEWAVLNIPPGVEPIVIGCYSLFFLLWGPGRRGVMSNLRAIIPGSNSITNFLRTYRVFWNYAWTITDNVRFKELRTFPDCEFAGQEIIDELRSREGGAIILTAHMGSYDLGAHLFSSISSKQIAMVRAPEHDPETRDYEAKLHARTVGTAVRIDFNTSASGLALDLLDSLQRGEIVAIQGDRVTHGIASLPATLFEQACQLPAGPFALAMAARVPIYPVFVIRQGRRRYRLLSTPPIHVVRTGRDRNVDLIPAMETWARQLERVIREGWYQWFAFQPFTEVG